MLQVHWGEIGTTEQSLLCLREQSGGDCGQIDSVAATCGCSSQLWRRGLAVPVPSGLYTSREPGVRQDQSRFLTPVPNKT